MCVHRHTSGGSKVMRIATMQAIWQRCAVMLYKVKYQYTLRACKDYFRFFQNILYPELKLKWKDRQEATLKEQNSFENSKSISILFCHISYVLCERFIGCNNFKIVVQIARYIAA